MHDPACNWTLRPILALIKRFLPQGLAYPGSHRLDKDAHDPLFGALQSAANGSRL